MRRKLWLVLVVVAGAAVALAASAGAVTTYPAVSVDSISSVEGAGFSGEVASFQDQALKGGTCAPIADYTVQVDWGDGKVTTPAAVFGSGPDQNLICTYSVKDAHTYAEEGSIPVTVTVLGPNSGAPGTGKGSAAVSDAPLTATSPGPESATPGTAFSATVARFTDADPGGATSDYTATIDWGDGSSSTGTIAPAGGGWTVDGSHTWSAPGSYPVNVAIRDAGGAATSASFTATVGGGSSRTQLAILSSAPRAGALVTFSAAGSAAPARIVSYDWDFNGDGRIDTSTGTNPNARFMFTPGRHTVSVTTVDSSGQRSTATRTFQVSGTAANGSFTGRAHGSGCIQELDISHFRLVADCIEPDPTTGGYTITGDPIDLNGTTLFTRSGAVGTFHLAYGALSGPDVLVELADTPIGDVVLGGLSLSAQPMVLDPAAARSHQISRFHATAADASDSPGIRLVSFAVGHQCSHGDSNPTCCPPSSPTTACATLPGSFPIAGQVNVYVNSSGESIFDVQVAISVQSIGFSATGGLRMTADLDTGIHLNSLRFAIPDSTFSVFSLKDTSFVYYWPDCGDPSHCDTWQAQAKINFAAVGGPELDGELDFSHGSFHHASLVLTLPPGVGVPLFPGVLLNRLGGEFGVDPLVFGGTLGASIAAELEATVSFRYREATATTLGVFGLQGTLELSDTQIAQLAFDLYTDGYIDGSLDLNLHFPLSADEDHRVVTIAGHVDFWDEPSSGRYQGKGSVELKIWIIDATVAGLINQDWLAGCASVEFTTPFGPVGGGLVGGYRRSDGHVDGYPFLGSCTDQDRLTNYETAPTTTHSGGFVGSVAPSTGSRPMALPHSAEEEIRLTGTDGVPVVTLTAPDGRSFQTSSNTSTVAGAPAHDGLPAYLSVRGPDPNQLLIAIAKPAAGVWHVTPVTGSPALAHVEIAQVIAPPAIHVHLRRLRGGREALSYRASNLGGGRLQLVARGRDSAQLLISTTRPSGAFTFTPAAALGRRRLIEADLTGSDGMPVQARTVASFTAPPPVRAGRPRHVRIVRHSLSAVVTWGAALHATHYLVTVRGSDGRIEQHFISARVRRVVVHEVLPFEWLRVRVIAYGGPDGLSGPAGSATLRRRAKPPRGL